MYIYVSAKTTVTMANTTNFRVCMDSDISNLILPELTLLANLESYNAILINQGKNQKERLHI